MAETLADLLRSAGIDYSGAATRVAEQTPYTPSTPLRRPTRPFPRQGDYARERQYRIEGARDRLLRGPDRLGAVGELAADLTGAPALVQHMRARMAGDTQSAATEGLTGLAQASGFVGLPGRSMRPLLGAARAPAEAAAVAPSVEWQSGFYRGGGSGAAERGGFRVPEQDTGARFGPGVYFARNRGSSAVYGDVLPADIRGRLMPASEWHELMTQAPRGANQRVWANQEAAKRGFTGVDADEEVVVFDAANTRIAESPQRIPRAIQPQTRASDGTILPAQPRETFGRPFSRTAGTSGDLREALSLRDQQLMARTQDLSDTTPMAVRRRVDAFRTQDNMRQQTVGMEGWTPQQVADWRRTIETMSPEAAQRMFDVISKRGAQIRTGALFEPPKPRSGESDLLASVGAPVAAAALFGSRKRRK